MICRPHLAPPCEQNKFTLQGHCKTPGTDRRPIYGECASVSSLPEPASLIDFLKSDTTLYPVPNIATPATIHHQSGWYLRAEREINVTAIKKKATEIGGRCTKLLTTTMIIRNLEFLAVKACRLNTIDT